MSIKIYFQRFNWQINISLGNGLSLTGYQAIFWINVDLDFCHHMAPTGHNESKDTFHQYCNLYAFHALTQVMSYIMSGAKQLTITFIKMTLYRRVFFKPSHTICICYLGAKSNSILFSLTRNDDLELQTAPGGGGKVGITWFSAMTITIYFILVADIFRLEQNANSWQTTFLNEFSLMKWFPCWFKEDSVLMVQLTSHH